MADQPVPPTTPTAPQHPLLAAVVEALRAVVAAAEAYDPDYLPTAVKADLVRELSRLNHAAKALSVRTLAGGTDLAEATGAKNPGTWAAADLHTDFARSAGDYRLGVRVAHWPEVAAAFGRGELSPEHVRAVLTSLETLPGDVEPERLAMVVKDLLGWCAEYTPRQVRLLGLKVLEVAAPDHADDLLARRLEADERRNDEACSMDLRQRADGSWTTEVTYPHWPGRPCGRSSTRSPAPAATTLATTGTTPTTT